MTLPPFTGDQAMCPRCHLQHAFIASDLGDLIAGRKDPAWPRRCACCAYTWPEA